MAKNKDFTGLFAGAFSKYDKLKGQTPGQQQGEPFTPTPENDAIAKAHNASLYPEKAGARAREKKQKEAIAYEKFIKSLTVSEVDNLKLLCRKPHLIIDAKVLKSMGEEGEDLGLDRLDAFKLIHRESIPSDGLIQFRISSKGRKVLRSLGYHDA